MSSFRISGLESVDVKTNPTLSSHSSAIQGVAEELNTLLDDALRQPQIHHSIVKIKTENDDIPRVDKPKFVDVNAKLRSCSSTVQDLLAELNSLLDDALQQTQDYNPTTKIKIEYNTSLLDEKPQTKVKYGNGITVPEEEFERFCDNLKTAEHLSNLPITTAQENRSDDFVRCLLCNYKARQNPSLKDHIKHNHQGKQPFICNKCNYTAPYREKPEGVIKTFSCNICQYTTAYISELKKHITKHAKVKAFGCNLCHFRTATKSYLKDHMRIHTGEKPFKCALCNYCATYKQNLYKHAEKHINQKPFECSTYNFKTHYNAELKHYMKNHTGERPFACNKCEYRSVYRRNLTVHMQKMHENISKPFVCGLCHYSTFSKSNLKKHAIVHSGDKPFACSVCCFRTGYKNSLKDHMKTHNNVKPFACLQCDFCTMAEKYLKQHMKKHDGMKSKSEKVFTCYICNMSTSWKLVLIRHMNVHRK